MRIRYARTNLNAVCIKRAHVADAGIDFYIPTDFKQTTLHPGESISIDSGIKIEIPFGYMGLFCNKSGIASKKDIIYGAHVIDAYYSGNIIINLHYIGKTEAVINPGDKIIQMVIVPVLSAQPEETELVKLYDGLVPDDSRKESGFGASGDK